MQKILKQVVGIDVAQKELVLSLGRMYEDFALEIHAYKIFCNTTKGFSELIGWVTKLTDRSVKEYFLFHQQQVKQLIDKERKVLPRLGVKKLYYQIQPFLQSKGIKMGRGKLFKLLGYYNLLIKPKRRYVQQP